MPLKSQNSSFCFFYKNCLIKLKAKMKQYSRKKVAAKKMKKFKTTPKNYFRQKFKKYKMLEEKDDITVQKGTENSSVHSYNDPLSEFVSTKLSKLNEFRNNETVVGYERNLVHSHNECLIAQCSGDCSTLRSSNLLPAGRDVEKISKGGNKQIRDRVIKPRQNPDECSYVNPDSYSLTDVTKPLDNGMNISKIGNKHALVLLSRITTKEGIAMGCILTNQGKALNTRNSISEDETQLSRMNQPEIKSEESKFSECTHGHQGQVSATGEKNSRNVNQQCNVILPRLNLAKYHILDKGKDYSNKNRNGKCIINTGPVQKLGPIIDGIQKETKFKNFPTKTVKEIVLDENVARRKHETAKEKNFSVNTSDSDCSTLNYSKLANKSNEPNLKVEVVNMSVHQGEKNLALVVKPKIRSFSICLNRINAAVCQQRGSSDMNEEVKNLKCTDKVEVNRMKHKFELSERLPEIDSSSKELLSDVSISDEESLSNTKLGDILNIRFSDQDMLCGSSSEKCSRKSLSVKDLLNEEFTKRKDKLRKNKYTKNAVQASLKHIKVERKRESDYYDHSDNLKQVDNYEVNTTNKFSEQNYFNVGAKSMGVRMKLETGMNCIKTEMENSRTEHSSTISDTVSLSISDKCSLRNEKLLRNAKELTICPQALNVITCNSKNHNAPTPKIKIQPCSVRLSRLNLNLCDSLNPIHPAKVMDINKTGFSEIYDSETKSNDSAKEIIRLDSETKLNDHCICVNAQMSGSETASKYCLEEFSLSKNVRRLRPCSVVLYKFNPVVNSACGPRVITTRVPKAAYHTTCMDLDDAMNGNNNGLEINSSIENDSIEKQNEVVNEGNFITCKPDTKLVLQQCGTKNIVNVKCTKKSTRNLKTISETLCPNEDAATYPILTSTEVGLQKVKFNAKSHGAARQGSRPKKRKIEIEISSELLKESADDSRSSIRSRCIEKSDANNKNSCNHLHGRKQYNANNVSLTETKFSDVETNNIVKPCYVSICEVKLKKCYSSHININKTNLDKRLIFGTNVTQFPKTIPGCIRESKDEIVVLPLQCDNNGKDSSNSASLVVETEIAKFETAGVRLDVNETKFDSGVEALENGNGTEFQILAGKVETNKVESSKDVQYLHSLVSREENSTCHDTSETYSLKNGIEHLKSETKNLCILPSCVVVLNRMTPKKCKFLSAKKDINQVKNIEKVGLENYDFCRKRHPCKLPLNNLNREILAKNLNSDPENSDPESAISDNSNGFKFNPNKGRITHDFVIRTSVDSLTNPASVSKGNVSGRSTAYDANGKVKCEPVIAFTKEEKKAFICNSLVNRKKIFHSVVNCSKFLESTKKTEMLTFTKSKMFNSEENMTGYTKLEKQYGVENSLKCNDREPTVKVEVSNSNNFEVCTDCTSLTKSMNYKENLIKKAESLKKYDKKGLSFNSRQVELKLNNENGKFMKIFTQSSGNENFVNFLSTNVDNSVNYLSASEVRQSSTAVKDCQFQM